MENRLKNNPRYQVWLQEQENKLRWLIDRHCTVIEFRYYLVLLLMANRKYKKAMQECKRILRIYPNEAIAQTLVRTFQEKTRKNSVKGKYPLSKRRRALKVWALSGSKKT